MNLLAISVTTYESPDAVDEYLGYLFSLVSELPVEIYIFDNSESSDVRDLCHDNGKYCNVNYISNNGNIGSPKNVIKALSYPKESYVMLLSVGTLLDVSHFKNIYDILSDIKPDFLSHNHLGRITSVKTKGFQDCQRVFEDLSWHLTNISVTIWSTEIVAKANFERYSRGPFPHLGALLEYISCNDFQLYWYAPNTNELECKLEHERKSSWYNRVFYLWCEQWPNFIYSLPEVYKLQSKSDVILEHNKKSNLFSSGNIISMRISGHLNFIKLFRAKNNYKYAHNLAFMFVVSITPKKMLSFFRYLKNRR
ncbi:MAG: hypothetical protein HRU38_11565 [Saccharospirillaceae bacterium]|nr:hypothetical protein [Saccharospirillaceae bacterium]